MSASPDAASAAPATGSNSFANGQLVIPGANTAKVGKYYRFTKVLGRGAFSVVKLATHKHTGQQWAVKVIEKERLSGRVDLMLNEVQIMTSVSHCNVIALREIYESSAKIYLVMEYVAGTDLFDRIANTETFTEREAAYVFLQLVSGVKYLHDHDIIHRDLKPENILVALDDHQLTEIKIADFGLSKIVGEDVTLKTSCGSPYYVAPEVLAASSYSLQADVWSCGVILYTLLCGFPPFYSENFTELFQMIKGGQFDFPSPYWDSISDDARAFVRGLLTVDPLKRMRLEDAIVHPWLVETSGIGEQLREHRARHAADSHERRKHNLGLHQMQRAKHRINSMLVYTVAQEARRRSNPDLAPETSSDFFSSDDAVVDDAPPMVVVAEGADDGSGDGSEDDDLVESDPAKSPRAPSMAHHGGRHHKDKDHSHGHHRSKSDAEGDGKGKHKDKGKEKSKDKGKEKEKAKDKGKDKAKDKGKDKGAA